MQGKLLQIAARAKQTREQITIKQLEANLEVLMEEKHRNPQIDLRHKIDDTRLALNLSLTTQVEKHESWSKHSFFTPWEINKPQCYLGSWYPGLKR